MLFSRKGLAHLLAPGFVDVASIRPVRVAGPPLAKPVLPFGSWVA